MAHTQEPWFVFPQWPDRFSIGATRHNSLSIKVAEAPPVKIITGAGDDSISEEEAALNTLRIVACVNACAGIPNEILASSMFRDAIKMKASYIEITRQRDELLATLRDIVSDQESNSDDTLNFGRAVLAKIEA